MLKKSFLFVSIVFITISAYCQKEYFYNGEFDHIGDNREYFNRLGHPQTILGARLNLVAGIKQDSLHTFGIGLNCMYEYGHRLNAWSPVPNLFYKFEDEHSLLVFGSFSREKMLQYPLAMLTDTLLYYRPNIQGALGCLKFGRSYQNVWIDWTSRQTDVVDETFLAGFSGKAYVVRDFFVSNYFYMFHHAGPAIKVPGKKIRDNGGAAITGGYDLLKNGRGNSRFNFLLEGGYIFSYDRLRPGNTTVSSGIIGFSKFNYIQRYGLDVSFFHGKGLQFAYGDMLYRAKTYFRFDPYFAPLLFKNIESRVAICFHIIEGDLNFSQQVMLSYKF